MTLLCAVVALLDGFDTQLMGPAGKAITASLGIPLSALGSVFSASQVGFLIGAFVFGALGDRFGRKRMLVFTTLLFGLSAFATALAPSYELLLLARLTAGLGLGGVTPSFVSLASEFAPPAQRARVVTTLWAAVPLGGMVAAFASSLTLPVLGWRFLFFVGGALPLLITPLLLAAMPESREGRSSGRGAEAPVRALFEGPRAISTAWLWLASFMTWTTLIVMAFWTPPLLQRAGWSAASAAQVLALNNAGGVLGTVLLGMALARLSPQRALTLSLLATGAALAALGFTAQAGGPAALPALVAGFFASASGGALLAVSAAAYPAQARSTGVGWALGVGRIGSVVGPAAAGALVAAQASISTVYLAMTATAAAAALFILLLSRSSGYAAARDVPLHP